MKRSEIENAIASAKLLLAEHSLLLPMFGAWTLDTWKQNRNQIGDIRKTMRGWDVTDFNSGDFARVGAVLFTLRNGLLGHAEIGCPYAEKYIIMQKGQSLPLHFHFSKTEDIINRGGATLKIQVFNSLPDESIDMTGDVRVQMDGVDSVVKAGTMLRIEPGNSLTIRPFMYHLFLADEGPLVAGEVSSINDDNTDNRFARQQGRFCPIVEDAPVTVPLCNEYDALLGD